MSKQPKNAQHNNEIETLKKSCKNMIEMQRAARNGKAKSCYSIIAAYDDKSKLEKKITVRDSNLDNFENLFSAAVSLEPDMVIVKIYEGEGITATELPESQNTIRIKEKSKPAPRRALNGNDELPMQPDYNADLKVQQVTFDKNTEIQDLKFKYQQDEWARNRTIEQLEADKLKLEAQVKEQADEIKEMDDEIIELKKNFGVTAQGLGSAALGALISHAAKNPNGKFLGLIPNAALAGLAGNQDGTAQLEADTEHASPRKVYYDQITEFFETLSDDEFEKVYAIVSQWVSDKSLISTMHGLMQNGSSQSQKTAQSK